MVAHTPRERQFEIPLPADTATLGLHGHHSALGGGDVDSVLHQHRIDFVKTLTLSVANTSRPAAFQLRLLRDLLQLHWLPGIKLVITEPAFDRATTGHQRETEHPDKTAAPEHQLASSAGASSDEEGSRVSRVRTLLSRTTLYWPRSDAKSRP